MKENDEIKKIKEILEKHEKRIKFLENMIPSLKSEQVKPVEVKLDFARLAQKIGADSEKIKQLFDIENSNLTLLKVVGEDEREKTKKISLVVLLGYKYFFGNEQVLSKEMKRNVAENRVPINNFARYLNELIPSMIRRMGKLKSPKTTYKLTPLGEAEAKEIIKKLCE
jgi:hypothetical protein